MGLSKCVLATMPKNKNAIIIIDAANLAYRAAYSFRGIKIKIPNNDVSVNSGIFYSIINTVMQLYAKYKPKAILFVFEGSKKNNPRFTFPEYKSKRPTSKTVDITTEMVIIREIVKLMGCIAIVPKAGEADDGIASACGKLTGMIKYIYSNDHDMQVLLNNNTHIIRGNDELLTVNSFETKYGFHPKYYSLYTAVTGDSSDNIPGIKGLGKMRVSRLFKTIIDNDQQPSITTVVNAILKSYGSKHKRSELYVLLERYLGLTQIRYAWDFNIEVEKYNSNKLVPYISLFKMRSIAARYLELERMIKHFEQHKRSVIKSLHKKPKPRASTIYIRC